GGSPPARHPPALPLYVPPNSASGVRARILTSSQGERLSTYQTSSSIRSSHGSDARPCTCAQPVIPGRTSRRLRWCGVYCSTWYASVGLGPIRLISPRTTFHSCGTSSSEIRLSTEPTRVMRVSPWSTAQPAPCRSAPTTIVLSFTSSTHCPSFTTRCSRQRAGPRQSDSL